MKYKSSFGFFDKDDLTKFNYHIINQADLKKLI